MDPIKLMLVKGRCSPVQRWIRIWE